MYKRYSEEILKVSRNDLGNLAAKSTIITFVGSLLSFPTILWYHRRLEYQVQLMLRVTSLQHLIEGWETTLKSSPRSQFILLIESNLKLVSRNIL